MEQCKLVYETLDKLNIKYEVVEHPVAASALEADKYIEGKEGVRTKTLFLCNRKKRNFYLIVMDDHKDLDIKSFEELTNEKGLHFCSSETLMNKLGLLPNSVTLFGLINNADHDVLVYIDKEIINEKMITFHPNDNTKTLFLSMDDMFKFLDNFEYKYNIIEL